MQVDKSEFGDECILIDVDVGGVLILNKVATVDIPTTLTTSETDVSVDVTMITVGDWHTNESAYDEISTPPSEESTMKVPETTHDDVWYQSSDY